MNLRKAAEMALECLEYHWDNPETDWEAHPDHVVEAKKALREALAEPKREWVGLTDAQVEEIAEYHGIDGLYETSRIDFYRAIEITLKEKNCDS